ncbi:MAG: glycosyltransferase [Planctomycetes bacterium]|nr:glycosyltransferase [Planctomycetota bacterium]
MTQPELSVVVPAFQEAKGIERNLDQLESYLASRGEDFEILCVDDGSTDGTAGLLRSRGERVRVLTHGTNLGKGAAVRTGMLAARGRRAVFLDADLSTDLADLEPLLAALAAGAEVAVGSRRVQGARIERRQPLLREWLGRVFSRLARLCVSAEVADFTCGFKAFSERARREIFERARIDGWAFDAEILAIARARGLPVAQVPVHWHHSGGSKVRVPRAALRSALDLGRIALQLRRGAWRP